MLGTSAEDAPNGFISWCLNVNCITDYFSFFLSVLLHSPFLAFPILATLFEIYWKGDSVSDQLGEIPPAFVVFGAFCCC